MTDTMTRPPETRAGRAARQMAADLIEAAELAERIEAATGLNFGLSHDRLLASASFEDDVPAALAAAARLMGGAEKSGDDDWFRLTRTFGAVEVEVFAKRGLACERVQVGTETVTETVVVTPAVARTETVERPVYEWRCGPLLVEPTKAVA